MKQNRLRVNMVSESAVSVQGHGVHTAFEEMAQALEKRDDIELIRNRFDEQLDVDVIHFHTVGPRTYKKLRQKKAVKVISAHVVPDSFVGSLLFARAWKPIAAWYLRWFYNKADALLAVSDATAADLRKLRVTAPIHVLYNSIDTDRYSRPSKNARGVIRKKLGIVNDAFVVIGAGQVQPRKRVDLFLQAARELPDVNFVWMGGVPFGRVAADHAEMKKLMDSKLPNLHFPGMVPLEEMVDFYAAADLFWLPSEQETFGLVVVEAAASGLPVLLRDIHDYDSTFGDLVARGTDETFVGVIKKFSHQSDYYGVYKAKATQLAKRFDSVASTEKLVGLYRDLL